MSSMSCTTRLSDALPDRKKEAVGGVRRDTEPNLFLLVCVLWCHRLLSVMRSALDRLFRVFEMRPRSRAYIRGSCDCTFFALRSSAETSILKKSWVLYFPHMGTKPAGVGNDGVMFDSVF